jgi:integrase
VDSKNRRLRVVSSFIDGPGQGSTTRFNLRHSLSNWMVNKAKVEPKTVQGILRHAKIQTTLDLYTQEDSDETLAAQGEYLAALGVATQLVQ